MTGDKGCQPGVFGVAAGASCWRYGCRVETAMGQVTRGGLGSWCWWWFGCDGDKECQSVGFGGGGVLVLVDDR